MREKRECKQADTKPVESAHYALRPHNPNPRRTAICALLPNLAINPSGLLLRLPPLAGHDHINIPAAASRA